MRPESILQKFPLLATLVLSTVLVMSVAPPAAMAQLVGVVCTAETSSTSCPSTPTVFTGTAGTELVVAVNIQNSDGINGFDIFVRADPRVLDAVGVDLTGTVLGQNIFVVAECIDGLGLSCGALQTGPGIVRVAAVALGFSTAPPTTGRLFSVKYNILSDTSGILVGFQTGCSGTSVPPDFCVTVVLGSTVVPETVLPTSIELGDFTINADTASLTVAKGSFALSTITLSSVEGFFGGISLSTSLSPARRNGPLALLSSPSVLLLPGTSTTATLQVIAFRNTPVGKYTVTVTGTSGLLSHSFTILVAVRPFAGVPP